ncbi:DUF4352 domain-containing protein [Brachybacterium sp. UNK5269]|uniref:DUF4352 domain-containing protein n=1 Tax=Brachybacterium sp. UNK5269 TaxID=3408576 RepID=UPI003BAF0AA0
METDREMPGEPDRAAGPAPQPRPESSGRDYDYGDIPLEPAGVGGPSAADGGAAAGDGPDPAPGTGAVPALGVPTATTPRAVLRPIPEGFPTPPPRPARRHRRPAPAPGPAPSSSRPRGLVLAGILAAVALLLVVAVGGGVLALRGLSPSAPAASDPAASDPVAASDPAAPAGTARIGEVTVEEVSTEVGVRAVGAGGSALEPEGEFVIITLTVRNPTDQVLTVSDNMTLETADGAGHAADPGAGAAHVAQSRPYGLVTVGGESTFHAVFDVPIGAEPTAVHLDFGSNADAGEGTLPLGG